MYMSKPMIINFSAICPRRERRPRTHAAIRSTMRPGAVPHPRPVGHDGPGQAMVEFAFVVVLFLGTIVAVFEGARLVATYFALANAAAEGARAGQYVTAGDASVQAAAQRTLQPWITITNVSTASTCSDNDVICICRRATAASACGSTPIERRSVIDVTIRYRLQLVPFAGGFVGQTAGINLTGYKRAIIE